MATPRLSWLHISDLHIQDRDEHARDQRLSALSRGFAPGGSLNDWHPDLLFITGDIANRGLPAEYAAAELELSRLMTACGVNRGRVFAVPGNHDLDRTLVPKRFNSNFDNEAEVDEFFGPEGAADQEILFRRFAAYADFENRALSGRFSQERPYVAQRITLGDLTIGVLGFNTGWLSHQDDVQGKLVASRRLIRRALEDIERPGPPDLLIALHHHPLVWLDELEQGGVRSLLMETADVALRGHLHSAVAESVNGGSGNVITLAAGALYQGSDWPSSALKVEVYDEHLEVQALSFADDGRGEWFLDVDLNRRAGGIRKIPLPRPLLAVDKPRPTKKVAQAEPPDAEGYLRYVGNEWGRVKVTGIVKGREVGTVGLREIYVPLRTVHPAVDRGSVTTQSDSQGLGKIVLRETSEGRLEVGMDKLAPLLLAVADSDDLVAVAKEHKMVCTQVLRTVWFSEAAAENQQEHLRALQRIKKAELVSAKDGDGNARRPEIKPQHLSDILTIVDMEDAFRAARMLVVEGDPGSGKSTTLQHVAMSLVEAHEGKTAWAERMGFEAPFAYPIFVPLRRFFGWLTRRSADEQMNAGSGLLLEFLRGHLAEYSGGDEWIEAVLNQGCACVLFDGLDEVPDDHLREKIAGLVRDFVQKYKTCRFVLSTRPSGLGGVEKGALLNQANMAHCHVRRLSSAQIHAFVHGWYKVLEPEPRRAEARAQALLGAVANSELAQSPITLVALLLVHHQGGELPEHLAKLYGQCIEALAGRWDLAVKEEVGEALCGELNTDIKVKLLQEIAWTIYTQSSHEADSLSLGRDELADVVQSTLPNELCPANREACIDLVDRLAERSGLLLCDEGQRAWRFRHKQFLEYLTARRIVSESSDNVQELGDVLNKAWWAPVVRLACGYAAECGDRTARDLVKGLLGQAALRPKHAERVQAFAAVAVGVLDAKSYGVRDFDSAVIPSTEAVVRLLNDPKQPGELKDRMQLSHLLGAFEDPRIGWQDALHMARVPAGPFYMGDKQRKVHLSEFRISRHPVTAGQFLEFIETGGYQNPKYWPHGEHRQDDVEALKARLKKQPALPATGVSWFDALAFCEWLNQAYARKDGTTYRLPTEAEWEKAGRGGLDIEPDPTKQREYPWAGTWNRALARADARPLQLAPIGCYAGGQGPYGTYDQAGNVWEWCLDERGAQKRPRKDPRAYDPTEDVSKTSDRVLRGGSFINGPRLLRLSHRGGFRARWRDDYASFRVVCSSLPRTLGI